MTKVTLPTIASGYNLTAINEAFTLIENELNNKVLYRDNPPGEPNSMDDVLDMNGKQIINLPAPSSPNSPARLRDVQNAAGGVVGIPSASVVPFAPTANISAITVQSAIEESDTENRNAIAQLASPAGGELVELSPPFAGAITRSVEYMIEGTAYPERYRLDSDPDDTLSIQRVLNLGLVCHLRPNKTYIASKLVAVPNTGIVCPGGRAVISVPAGTGNYGIRIQVNNFHIDGVNFDGGNMGPYNSGSPVFGTRNGIIIGNTFGTGTTLRGISVLNSEIYGFDCAGILGREIQIGFVFGFKCNLSKINAYNCRVGFWYSPRFEYVVSESCYGYDCFVGCLMAAGNNSNMGCHYENNQHNCQMSAGENDAHGQFVACSFNHAFDNFGIGIGLYAVNIANGHSFTSCAFWFANIKLENATGIQIRNSQIVISQIEIIGGGLNSIDDNWIKDPIVPTLTGFTFTSFRRNRTNIFDTNLQSFYPEQYMRGTATTSAFPLAFNSTTVTTFPMVYATKKYMGNDASFLESLNRASTTRTGLYSIDATLIFNTLGASQGVELQIQRINSALVVQETVSAYEDFPASTTGCTVNKRIEMLATAGDYFLIRLRTSTATGVSITGVDVRIRTID